MSDYEDMPEGDQVFGDDSHEDSLQIIVHEVNTIWRWVLVENGIELHEGAALSQRTAQRNAEMVQRIMRHE